MCGIAGILSKSGENVVPQLGLMLNCMVNRGPDGAGLVVDGRIIKSSSVRNLQDQSLDVSGSSALGHNRLAIVGGTCGTQPFMSCDGRFILEHNGEIYNYKELRKKIKKRHVVITDTDSEIIVHLLEEHAKNSGFIGAIGKTLSELDGVYALAIKDNKTGHVALVRDRIGVRQLYYAETSDHLAFASERKALWQIGIPEPTKRVMPGTAIIISPDGRYQSFQVADPIPAKSKILYRTMESAAEAYRLALVEAMKKRTQDFDKIGIIFSGGIDSVLIAHMASELVPEVVCYTGGIKGSSDIANAKQIAKRLGLDLRICEFSSSEVESLLPRVIDVIEDSNAGQVEVALPVYGAVGLAHKDGIRVMLTGQGADELFGGYSWYPKVAGKEGLRTLGQHMVQDLHLLYKETLEREDKITMAHSIELREPYLDPEVIRVALSTDLRLNIRGDSDPFGKRVHRRLAMNLGIPKQVAYRIKEAAQHGSGIHSTLDAIARNRGFDEHSVPASYMEELAKREKIGSSQRYGYMFGDESIWISEPHVQMYLDSISGNLMEPCSQVALENRRSGKTAV